MSGHRSAVRGAAAACALIAAALTVGASPAQAAPATPTVEFSGGSVLSLLVCKSEPSTGSVSVPAESRVNFVNRLGQDATLKVDGTAMPSVVHPNQAVPVLFKKGPVNVEMTFSCGVGVVEQFKPVSVGVTAAPAAPPAARQGTGQTSGQGAGQGGSSQAGGPAGAAAAAANQAIAGSRTPSVKSTRKPSTTSTTAAGEGDVTGTEPVDPAESTDPSATPAAAAAGNPSSPLDDRVVVEQPVAAQGPASNGPAGLLALVATVCVVGVGIAAIRAIIAQRSSRASYA